VLEKVEPIKTKFERGTRLCISSISDGVAEPKHPHDKEAATTVAKLAVDLDFENPGALPQRTVVDANGITHLSYLCPIILS